MRKLILNLSLICLLVFPLTVLSGELKTDIEFMGTSVSGRYHVPREAVAVVEGEKQLNPLFKVRKHFRDLILEDIRRDEVRK